MTLNTNPSAPQNDDEVQLILDSIQKIEQTPELMAEAVKNPQSVLDRLRLSGVARHAVALGIAGLLVVPGVATAQGYWQ